jgi:hypothetical protein
MFKTVSEPGRMGNGTVLDAPSAILGSLLQPHQLRTRSLKSASSPRRACWEKDRMSIYDPGAT